MVRAEPINALYEQVRVHHVGVLATLEDQMANFAIGLDRAQLGGSPDRVDALVWALTELMIGETCWGEFYALMAETAKGGKPLTGDLGIVPADGPAPPPLATLRAPPAHGRTSHRHAASATARTVMG